MPSSYPPLPNIEGDVSLLLELYKHRQLTPVAPVLRDHWGDIDRLEELGRAVFDLAVTTHLFNKKPLLSTQEIHTIKQQYLDTENWRRWGRFYDLQSRIVYNPRDMSLDVDDIKRFFYSYAGAVYFQSGIAQVSYWISNLVEPDSTPAAEPPLPWSPPHPTMSMSPPPPSTIPPPFPPMSPPFPSMSPSPPRTNPASDLITLALVNQTAAQKGCLITYNAQQEGPPHQPTWTVQCLINGQVKGQGQGKNQKLGKEKAAREAYINMGWYS